jgi:hypothetical protein
MVNDATVRVKGTGFRLFGYGAMSAEHASVPHISNMRHSPQGRNSHQAKFRSALIKWKPMLNNSSRLTNYIPGLS